MSLNYFEGKTVEWLLSRRDALQDILASGSGSQVVASLSPGMRHEFSDLTQAQIEQQLQRVLYALFVADPVTYPTNPYKKRVMGISTVYPDSYYPETI